AGSGGESPGSEPDYSAYGNSDRNFSGERGNCIGLVASPAALRIACPQILSGHCENQRSGTFAARNVRGSKNLCGTTQPGRAFRPLRPRGGSASPVVMRT